MVRSEQAYRYQLILSVIGLLLAAYLTAYHYLNIPLACPESQVLDCASVLNSSYSVVFGIPVAVMGLAFFAVMLLLLGVVKNREYVLYWNVLGFVTLFYFWFGEYMLGKICVFCTAVHVTVILLLAVTYLREKEG